MKRTEAAALMRRAALDVQNADLAAELEAAAVRLETEVDPNGLEAGKAVFLGAMKLLIGNEVIMADLRRKLRHAEAQAGGEMPA